MDVKTIAEIGHYTGENAIEGIRFKPARQALGVRAWGMNVLEFEPNTEGYPEHDHQHDGQEELYVVLEGSVVLRTNGEDRVLERGAMARVGPETRRKLLTRAQGATVLAIGATPGKAYAPDPRLG